jgi:predicted regulator of Ras-like GTPase activity (Roadblock/LC7/MglB family)
MDELELAKQLARLAGVDGVVIVTTEGAVVGCHPAGEAEKYGSTVAMMGVMALQVGDALTLGPANSAVLETSKASLLVMRRPYGFVGLLLAESAAAASVAVHAERILR